MSTNLALERAEWLNARRGGIGGSDAAAVAGLSRYKTAYTVWADKTGRLPELPDNEAMRQGRDLEEYVARRFREETGKKVVRVGGILRNNAYPFALANIDRKVVGESAGLECKTTSVLNLRRFKNGAYPAEYYCQCCHYMAVTGYAKWYLAVLVLNTEFRVYEITRDEAEGDIEALMDVEREFWGTYVETDTPPPADGLRPTTEVLNRVFGGGKGGVDILDLHSTIEYRQALKAQIVALETKLDEQDQIIKMRMGDAETGYCGEYTATWKPRSARRFDEKRFLADHPAVSLDWYYKESRSRTFIIKETDNDAKRQ